jgi:hypothetical protein
VGRYRICVPPFAGDVEVESLALGRRVEHGHVRVDGPSAVLFDVQIPMMSSSRPSLISDMVLTDAESLGLSDLRGEVLDQDRQMPLPSAIVRLSGTPYQTVTDDAGRFSFEALAPGRYALEVRSLGYSASSAPVELPADKSVYLGLRVAPEAIELEGLEVTARTTGEQATRSTPFRRNMVYGAAMAEEEERGALAYETLRRSTAGIRITERWREGSPPVICIETNRRIQRLRRIPADRPGELSGCDNAQVVVDGIRIHDGPEFLRRTPASELESIEFVTPVQAQILYGVGGDTSNGVVVVYTRGNGPYASPRRQRQ